MKRAILAAMLSIWASAANADQQLKLNLQGVEQMAQQYAETAAASCIYIQIQGQLAAAVLGKSAVPLLAELIPYAEHNCTRQTTRMWKLFHVEDFKFEVVTRYWDYPIIKKALTDFQPDLTANWPETVPESWWYEDKPLGLNLAPLPNLPPEPPCKDAFCKYKQLPGSQFTLIMPK